MNRSRRGYTATEVLVALALVAIGAAGVITMQRTTIQGNVDARRMDMANAIARKWIERLRTDAMLWTTPSARVSTSNFANAKLLQYANSAPAQWVKPTARFDEAPNWSPGIDVLGEDALSLAPLADGSNPYLYCTHVRLTWLVTDQLMRADVRVFWPRGVGVTNPPSDYAKYCESAAVSADLDTRTDAYHFVYATTALRRNALQ